MRSRTSEAYNFEARIKRKIQRKNDMESEKGVGKQANDSSAFLLQLSCKSETLLKQKGKEIESEEWSHPVPVAVSTRALRAGRRTVLPGVSR